MLRTLDSLTTSPIKPTIFTADPAGDTFQSADNTFLQFQNTSASAITITIVGVGVCNQGFVHDDVFTVPANDSRIITDLDQNRFRNPSTGIITVNYSSATGLNVIFARYSG